MMIADTLRYFQIETCNHLYLLAQTYDWAKANQRPDISARVSRRLDQLYCSAWNKQRHDVCAIIARIGKPLPRPMIRWWRDEAERDYADEAAAHGVSVRELLAGD